jgi:hypothetical protein
MTKQTTRRAVLAGAAALPALSLPAIASDYDIEQLWRKRMTVLAQLAENSAAYKKADDTLPAWARPGPNLIMKDGSYSKDCCGWPEIENPEPSAYGEAMSVRPNLYEIRARFEANPFNWREDVKALYRQRVRQFIARIREQRRLKEAAGIPAIAKRADKLCDALQEVEETIQQACLPGAYIALAMTMLIQLSYDDLDGAKSPVRTLQVLMPILPQYLATEAQKEIQRIRQQEDEQKAA